MLIISLVQYSISLIIILFDCEKFNLDNKLLR